MKREDIEQLRQAFNDLANGIRETQVSNTYSEAENANKEIDNDNTLDLQTKFNKKNALAKDLQFKLTSLGVDGARIKSATSAISPVNMEDFNTLDQMRIHGAMTGNKVLSEMADRLYRDKEKQEMNAYKKQLEAKNLSEQSMIKWLNSQGLDKSGKRTDGSAKLKSLDTLTKTTLSNYDKASTSYAEIDNYIKKGGKLYEDTASMYDTLDKMDNPASSFIRNRTVPNEFRIYKQAVLERFNSYKKEISGTAVSERERPDLEKTMIQLGDNQAVITEKINYLKRLGTIGTARALLTAGADGQNISNPKFIDIIKKGEELANQRGYSIFEGNEEAKQKYLGISDYNSNISVSKESDLKKKRLNNIVKIK